MRSLSAKTSISRSQDQLVFRPLQMTHSADRWDRLRNAGLLHLARIAVAHAAIWRSLVSRRTHPAVDAEAVLCSHIPAGSRRLGNSPRMRELLVVWTAGQAAQCRMSRPLNRVRLIVALCAVRRLCGGMGSAEQNTREERSYDLVMPSHPHSSAECVPVIPALPERCDRQQVSRRH